MKVSEVGRLLLGATLVAPVCALEDGLRMMGMDIHPKGLAHNSEGKSIVSIWQEEGEHAETRTKERAEVQVIMDEA
jgi:hypothetical protein